MFDKILLIFCLFVITLPIYSQKEQKQIKLIVRADDIGFCHAANEAIIKVYKEGIARSAEIIVPSPWFIEAVKLLNDNPGYDVGIHLCLTSEWTNIKWRPLTEAKSLRDTNGYFFPFLWPNEMFPKNCGNFLTENNPNNKEIELEFRKQIETGKKLLKNLTHISTHMACNFINPEVTNIVKNLAREYKLLYETPDFVNRLPGLNLDQNSEKERENYMINILQKLTPGTHILITHPCLNTDESKQINTPGDLNASFSRNAEAELLMNPKIKRIIKERNIKLISVNEAFH